MGESWYRGTADSVFQNLHLIEEYRGDAVLVFGADHIYKMNIRQMTDFHFQKGAMATIACLPIKKSEANQFGIVQVDERGAGGRLPGEAGARSGHHPRRSRALPRLDGELRLRPGPAHRGAAGRRGARVAPRLRPQHPAVDGQVREGVRLQLRPQPHPRRLRRGRERLLARRRDHRRLLRGQHGPQERRPQPEPLQLGLAHRHRQLPRPARQAGVRRGHPARHRAPVDPLGRLHRRRRLRQGLGAGAERLRRRWRRGARLDPVRQRLRRPRRARQPRHRRQERARPRRRPHRARPGARRPPLHGERGGVTVVQKARDTLLTRSRNF